MLKRVGLTVALCVLVSSPLFAQATATISGRVVDQAGAVLPGATITVTNAATGAVRETVTNEEGLYSVPALLPGTYKVRAALAGFSAQEREGLEVLIGANMAVEMKLGIAALQENITVSGQSPLVESTQAVVASSIRQQEVAQLPMMNRSISALMTMLPGAREVPATVSAKGQSVSWVSVGGGGGQNVNMVVDGMDNKEDHCGGASMAYSLDGIQEFQVFKTGAQAEYGRGTAAVLVATKSGTNRFSGSAFGFYRNESRSPTTTSRSPSTADRASRRSALADRRIVRRPGAARQSVVLRRRRAHRAGHRTPAASGGQAGAGSARAAEHRRAGVADAATAGARPADAGQGQLQLGPRA